MLLFGASQSTQRDGQREWYANELLGSWGGGRSAGTGAEEDLGTQTLAQAFAARSEGGVLGGEEAPVFVEGSTYASVLEELRALDRAATSRSLPAAAEEAAALNNNGGVGAQNVARPRLLLPPGSRLFSAEDYRRVGRGSNGKRPIGKK